MENVWDVIITCFVLHNFCQVNSETYLDQDGVLEDLGEGDQGKKIVK